jgi:hypothetical protein
VLAVQALHIPRHLLHPGAVVHGALRHLSTRATQACPRSQPILESLQPFSVITCGGASLSTR